jgi:tRNA dimethylallyltransferase
LEQQQQSTSILPVVVGGTMMYLQWLVHGRPDAVRPTVNAVQRASTMIDSFRIATTAVGNNTHGNNDEDDDVNNKGMINIEDYGDIASWDVASEYVKSLGPLFARRVTKLPGRDWYRLRRLLEVAYTIASSKIANNVESIDDGTSEITMDEREKKILSNLTEEEVYTGLRSGSLSDLGYDVRCFFLCPADRMTHFHVVDDRCERMVLSGLLHETANMYISGALSSESQITRAIGYRQALQYLRREGARRNDIEAFTAFMDEFMSATRQYAKKQMQWFRRDDEFAFVPIQMNDMKDIRVSNAANIIAGLCQLRRDDFDMELRSSSSTLVPSSNDADDLTNKRDEERQPSLSTQTKLDNEKQGKTMKFFISKRMHLVNGMAEFTRIMSEADRCTLLVQGSIGDETM